MVEKEPKFFQLGFEGQQVEYYWSLDLPSLYEKLLQDFPRQMKRETSVSQVELEGKTRAFLLFFKDEEVERLLVVGVTPKGYFASPKLLLEKSGDEPPLAFSIHLGNYWDEVGWRNGVEPWKKVIDSGGSLVNRECLGVFRDFIKREETPFLLDVNEKQIDFFQMQKLLKKWGFKIPFKTYPVFWHHC